MLFPINKFHFLDSSKVAIKVFFHPIYKKLFWSQFSKSLKVFHFTGENPHLRNIHVRVLIMITLTLRRRKVIFVFQKKIPLNNWLCGLYPVMMNVLHQITPAMKKLILLTPLNDIFLYIFRNYFLEKLFFLSCTFCVFQFLFSLSQIWFIFFELCAFFRQIQKYTQSRCPDRSKESEWTESAKIRVRKKRQIK